MVRFPARSLGVFLAGVEWAACGKQASRSSWPRARARRICLPRALRQKGCVHLHPRLSCRVPRRSDPCRKLRNIRLTSIACAFRPRLRHRLTPGGRTCPGKPWDSGDRDSHPVFRYSCPHNHLYPLHVRSPLRFDANTTLLYHSQDPRILEIRSFGNRFSPDHFRRTIARLVSCYALFK